MSSTRFRPINAEEPFLRHAQAFESQYKELFHHNTLLSPHARLAFETLEKVGEGGMGTVYRILDKRLGREAALKLLIASETDEKDGKDELARERFLREAEITARLDHPAIPPVYEAGMASDGQLYMLMRLIRGETLSEKIREVHDAGQGSSRDLLEILVKVGEAVAYAHRQGVIHRDLKPSNIMVGGFGEVMVMDWGIAKELARSGSKVDRILASVLSEEMLAEAGLTLKGAIVGTLGYMSPEQIEGGEVDERSDVFSLGLILIELLIGVRAIAGNTAVEQAIQTMSGDFRNYLKYRDKLSKEMVWILEDALRIKKEERTKSCALFVSRLKAALQGAEIPGYPYTTGDRFKKQVQARAGWVIIVTLVLFLVTLLLSVWLSLENERQKSKTIEAQRQLAESKQAIEKKRREDAEAKTLDAAAKLDLAKAEANRRKRVLVLFSEARTLMTRGSPFEKIDSKIKEALKVGKRTEEQLLTASQIYMSLKQFERTVALLEECAQRFPPGYSALFQLSRVGAIVGDNDLYYRRGIKKIVEIAEREGEENEHTLFARGLMYSDNGQIDKAIEAYTKAETYSRTLALMYYNRAFLWEGKKEYKKAFRDLDRFILLKPNDPRGYNARGNIARNAGDLDRSITDLNKAISIKGDDASYYYHRGYAWELKGVLDKALKDYSQAISLNPKKSEYFGNRGIVWISYRQYAKAEADLTKAIALDSTITGYFVNRGNVRNLSRNYDGAIADFQQAISLNPKDATCHVYLGSVYMAKRNEGKAMELFNRALKLDSENTKGLFARGQVYQLRGQFNKALLDFNRALELKPNFVQVILNRGDLWFAKKQYARALIDYNKYLTLVPNSLDGLLQRGNTFSSMNKKAEAIADFESFLRLAPNHPLAANVRRAIINLKGSSR